MSYDVAAPVYDAIYTKMKSYPAEAERVHSLIRSFGRPGSSSLLDVACGTGLHALELGKWYDVDGLDLSHEQLRIARDRLPARVNLYEDDMRTFRLDRTYDAVTCLFSAIGHLLTFEDLVQAFTNMARHLEPGGILLVEPWIRPSSFTPGHMSLDDVQEPGPLGRRILRIGTTTREGNLIRLKLQHTVQRRVQYSRRIDTVVDHFTTEEDLMMSTEAELLEALRTAGLDGSFLAEGLSNNCRGILLGVKSQS